MARKWAEAKVHSGKTLAVLRRLAGLSQPELAAASGVSEGLIANIEVGRRQPSKATVLALHAVLSDALEPSLGAPLPIEAWAVVAADGEVIDREAC